MADKQAAGERCAARYDFFISCSLGALFDLFKRFIVVCEKFAYLQNRPCTNISKQQILILTLSVRCLNLIYFCL